MKSLGSFEITKTSHLGEKFCRRCVEFTTIIYRHTIKKGRGGKEGKIHLDRKSDRNVIYRC
jgi:hypothetical protein